MAMTTKRTMHRENGHVHYLSRRERHALFDRRARELMGMSGEEFLRRWDAGEFNAIADDPDRPEVMLLATLIPFGR
jgi:hypothetical protein